MLSLPLREVLLLIAIVQYSIAVQNANYVQANSSSLQASGNLPRTCSLATNRFSGVQLIHPQPGFREPFEVLCDQEYEGGEWIVIQNRYDGSVHFYRDWDEYERGFGNLFGEFWLGLKQIHELTYSMRYELHIIVEDWDGIRAIAKYSDFLVAGPKEKYKLRSLGAFNGSAGDSLTEIHLGMNFTTFDADNDIYITVNCAVDRYGAWWFKNCSHAALGSSLNGRHMQGLNNTAINWNSFRRDYYGLQKSRMMIRAVK